MNHPHRRFIQRLWATRCAALWTLLLIASSGAVAIAPADVSLEKALELARHEALRLGLDIHDMSFVADEANTRWRSYRQSTPGSAEILEVDAKLSGRRFWAVYGAPKPQPRIFRAGGDIFVFVERDSGTIITVLQGR